MEAARADGVMGKRGGAVREGVGEARGAMLTAVAAGEPDDGLAEELLLKAPRVCPSTGWEWG